MRLCVECKELVKYVITNKGQNYLTEMKLKAFQHSEGLDLNPMMDDY
jgi:hypothetical protein